MSCGSCEAASSENAKSLIVEGLRNPSQQLRLSIGASKKLQLAETYCFKHIDCFTFLKKDVIPFLALWIQQTSISEGEPQQVPLIRARSEVLTGHNWIIE